MAEVERQRDALLADIVIPANASPALAAPLEASRRVIETAAAERIAQLQGQPGPAAATRPLPLNNGGRPWHPVDNPLAYRLLPSWLNAHLNHRLERLQANLQPDHERGSQLIKRFMAALPATLFALMPLLALVLRLLYWRRPMGYLEHLVVALYSHAWLLTALLLGSLASIAAAASGIALAATAANVLAAALWLAVPVYLWRMQRRVYGGGLLLHSLRFATTGSVYGVLVLLATLYAMLASLTA